VTRAGSTVVVQVPTGSTKEPERSAHQRKRPEIEHEAVRQAEALLGIGIDIASVDRVREVIERRPRIVDRLFSEEEKRYCAGLRNPWEAWASSFAAKEAVIKAFGASPAHLPWKQVWVDRSAPKPAIRLTGRAEAFAAERRVSRVLLSLSHDAGVAVAVVLVLTFVPN
jgi:holo-[acyl-carrier protein] synthase